MSRKRKLAIVALLATTVAVAGGLVFWAFFAPLAVGQELVGTWDVASGGEPSVAVEGAPPEMADDLSEQLGQQFQATQQLRFGRNGKVTHTANLLGVVITSEGTWTARRGEGDQLLVTQHLRISARLPDGTVKEGAEVATESVVTILDADRLQISQLDNEGKRQRFIARRVKK